ncbi:MAG: molybdenum cofactor biosynthesis protein MoaE [Dehalococcoidia bacterium]|jgi:molybdopterin synthase catalytic subunit|nr:molybdenum cofactor biosynthesis protein MoaE [Dehalococcoidia bacterium]MDP7469311.1 molybdenum cofactor biosynthesis protein MoaE [Dehalococcoidia bacterium]
MIELTQQPLSPQAVIDRIQSGRSGAVATFLGVVRGENEGREVLYLEYEAFEPLAREKMQELVMEIKSRYGVGEVAMSHRLGRAEVGEVVTIIAVASAHRAEAFDACRYGIEQLKTRVPIWKKEVFRDGEHWVGG